MDSISNGLEAYGIHDIEEMLKNMHQPRFRAKQIIEWAYKHGMTSYEQMTNIPASLRAELSKTVPFNVPKIVKKQVSVDGTRKYLIQLNDGCLIETVGIPSYATKHDAEEENERLTVCFSTQVGCAMKCAFCATGQQGLTRNLLPGEMVQQLLIVQKDFGVRVSNAVAMGQGEPFENFDNVAKALEIINSKIGMELGARRITVSTCGIPQGIVRFGKIPEQYTLALSLHAAKQDVRDRIMPGCKNIPINRIRKSLEEYYDEAHRRISIEYLLMKGINDSREDIKALEDFCSGLHVHINLIMLNKVPNSPFVPVSKEKARVIEQELKQFGIETTIRNSRGSDIDGACGQLKSSVIHA